MCIFLCEITNARTVINYAVIKSYITNLKAISKATQVFTHGLEFYFVVSVKIDLEHSKYPHRHYLNTFNPSEQCSISI